ncbi:heme peroxidase [Jimgerdemannia flammicorona]|uniref:Heme peroxidase n=1 Tax=Jimgerdemannia flammicorona TaxID=994334 RepID=A0A433QBV9_9FUNG|nr:heme peroxidase [Jimgerdemannia flammicorona]
MFDTTRLETVSTPPSPPITRDLKFEKGLEFYSCQPEPERNKFVKSLVQRFWSDLEHPPRVWTGAAFRLADGSKNSHIYPDVGKSKTPFSRTVSSKTPRKIATSDLPDPAALFERLMMRPKDNFEPSLSGVNSLLFYFAILITHDLFNSDPQNPSINLTTHYVDQSWLYGANEEDQCKVRVKTDGLLKPDYFPDNRFSRQLPGVGALLVLFSRNHNFIAKQLLTEANAKENYRFTHEDGKGSKLHTDEHKDELLFQTARLINNACYVNLILHAYLNTILGFPKNPDVLLNPLIELPRSNSSCGNICSMEFNYVYRWHSALGEKDAQWLEDHISQYLSPKATDLQANGNIQNIADGPNIPGLTRQHNGYFKDEDIITWILHGMKNVSGRFGANKIPAAFKDVEISGIKQGRKYGLCTLNEFRRHFGLKEHTEYKDLNPDPNVAAALKDLYPLGVDTVELYPGLVIEEAKSKGVGFPYTTSRAILSDAANLTRNDRFLTDELTPHNLTNWGWGYANGNDMFARLVENNLPTWNKVAGNGSELWLKVPFLVPETKSRSL